MNKPDHHAASGRQTMHPGVWALAVTAFAIGVAEFIVVGVLPAIAQDLSVPLARAGSLVGLYALALAIGTPITVLTLARFPRKPVLLALVAMFLLGNLCSALSTNYNSLLLGRIITAVAHGSFFAIGATVAAGLAPRGQASKAIAAMFAGLTLAMVIGVPLGSVLGNGYGWRLPFYAVTALAVLAWLATAYWLPRVPTPDTAKVATQLAALAQPAILAMMAVTALGFGASFASFAYIAPILITVTGFTPSTASALLMVFGLATFVGNLAGGRVTASLGWQTALVRLFISLAIALAALAFLLPYRIPMVALLFAWGAIAFGMSPGFQTGMLATAERYTPRALDFASGLNISAFNLGIALGESLGGAMVSRGHIALTPWAGVLVVLLGLVPLMWLSRRTAPTHTRKQPQQA